MKIVIDIPNVVYEQICKKKAWGEYLDGNESAIANGTPLTPDVLADMLMEERIRGEFEQDISYSKEVIDDVRCRLTVEIIDRRPCYCGAELRAVWRERKESEE